VIAVHIKRMSTLKGEYKILFTNFNIYHERIVLLQFIYENEKYFDGRTDAALPVFNNLFYVCEKGRARAFSKIKFHVFHFRCMSYIIAYPRAQTSKQLKLQFCLYLTIQSLNLLLTNVRAMHKYFCCRQPIILRSMSKPNWTYSGAYKS